MIAQVKFLQCITHNHAQVKCSMHWLGQRKKETKGKEGTGKGEKAGSLLGLSVLLIYCLDDSGTNLLKCAY